MYPEKASALRCHTSASDSSPHRNDAHLYCGPSPGERGLYSFLYLWYNESTYAAQNGEARILQLFFGL